LTEVDYSIGERIADLLQVRALPLSSFARSMPIPIERVQVILASFTFVVIGISLEASHPLSTGTSRRTENHPFVPNEKSIAVAGGTYPQKSAKRL